MKRVWIDFDEVKAKIGLPEILATFGIKDQFEPEGQNRWTGPVPYRAIHCHPNRPGRDTSGTASSSRSPPYRATWEMSHPRFPFHFYVYLVWTPKGHADRRKRAVVGSCVDIRRWPLAYQASRGLCRPGDRGFLDQIGQLGFARPRLALQPP